MFKTIKQYLLNVKIIIKTFFYCAFLFSVIALTSCHGNTNAVASSSAKSSAGSSTQNNLLDTTKLKSDLNDVISSIDSGNPDTTKMKNAAANIMTTDANILSDSGIDKIYGDSNDPSVKTAANALKKMRNSMGITPDKLDSVKKASADLQSVSH